MDVSLLQTRQGRHALGLRAGLKYQYGIYSQYRFGIKVDTLVCLSAAVALHQVV